MAILIVDGFQEFEEDEIAAVCSYGSYGSLSMTKKQLVDVLENEKVRTSLKWF